MGEIIIPHEDENPLFQAFDVFSGLRDDRIQEVKSQPVRPEIETGLRGHYFPAVEDDGRDDGFPGAER